MITDNLLRLSGALTAVPAVYVDGAPSAVPVGQETIGNGSNVSTNTVDLGALLRDVGEGKALYMVWTVTVAFTRAAGALNTTFQVLNDDDPALGSPVILAASAAIPKADLVVGKQIVLQIPPQIAGLGLRYLGANVSNDAAADTGRVCCDIVETIEDGKKFYTGA
jgi:hypothetical protein